MKITDRLRERFDANRERDARLRRIAEIIETVDGRCLAADGPVTATLNEMTQQEISEIYELAKGRE